MSDQTPWKDSASGRFPQLQHDLTCDVLVIGGGITGLTAAWLLVKAGRKVCLIERNSLGDGETSHTTAHLTYVTDRRLHQLVSSFGRHAARLAWQGGAAAISTIEKIAASQNIECDFRRVPGFLHASLETEPSENDVELLQKDRQLAQEMGFEASYASLVHQVNRPGVRFANQAKFHPLRYLSGLAKSIVDAGGMIFEGTTASEFTENPRCVTANQYKIHTNHLIVATHVPIVGAAGFINSTLLQTKLVQTSTYAVAAHLPKDIYPEAVYWDTSDPYYYLRIDRGTTTDYAILGGQDHKTGQVENPSVCYHALETTLRTLLPEARIERRWSGQVIDTHDGLPYIGETAPRQFSATGFSGNGMTFGTLAGMMACDAVLDRENPWKALFSPDRKKLSSGWDYIKENFDYPYYLLRDRLAGADVASEEDVAPGEGKILVRDGARAACARDMSGRLQTVSAICTHMGCVVHWNQAEKTWDCPCHGSRFEPSGAVIAGPANTPLKPLDARHAASGNE